MLGRDSRALVEYAARLMHEQAIDDVQDALRRAVRALGLPSARLPSPEQVRAALQSRLDLFSPGSELVLQSMRVAALEAMEFLAEFKPRVIGSVVEGAAQRSDRIRLLCECDTPDVLAQRLDELRIPAEQQQRTEHGELLHAFEFKAGSFDFLLTALPPRHSMHIGQGLNALQLRRLINRPTTS